MPVSRTVAATWFWMSLLAGSAAMCAWSGDDRGGLRGSPVDPEAAALFTRRIHPLLKDKCFRCHGDGEELEGDLDLRSRTTMLQGGKRGPALVPGRPAESLIYEAVKRTEPLAMPPKEKEKLTADEVAAIRVWIEAGAPWIETAGDRDH